MVRVHHDAAVAAKRTTLEQRPRRSPTDLTEAFVHVQYEVSACAEYARRLAARHAQDRDEEIAYLEAVLLHARALHEFLIKPIEDKPRLEDMLRTDFGPEWHPTAARDETLRRAANALAAAVEDMHKHLAHLTWARVENPAPAVWSFVEIARETLIVVGAWARHVAAKSRDGQASRGPHRSEAAGLVGVRERARLLAEIAESRSGVLASLLTDNAPDRVAVV